MKRTIKSMEKKHWVIALDFIEDAIGYELFSRFQIEGRYENELLMLGPVAVKTQL